MGGAAAGGAALPFFFFIWKDVERFKLGAADAPAGAFAARGVVLVLPDIEKESAGRGGWTSERSVDEKRIAFRSVNGCIPSSPKHGTMHAMRPRERAALLLC